MHVNIETAKPKRYVRNRIVVIVPLEGKADNNSSHGLLHIAKEEISAYNKN